MNTRIFGYFCAILGISFIFVVQSLADCMSECQQRYLDKVNLVGSIFNSRGSAHYHDLQWQKASLDAAKSEFDACRTTC